MPDLKSELMKLDNLTFDDDVGGEPAPITPTKVNVSKLIWDTIKENPLQNSMEIATLMNNGDMTGISTRLKQMLDRGVLARTELNGYWAYTTVGDAYPTFDKLAILAKAHAARREKKIKREKQKQYAATYKAKKQVVEAPAIPSTSLTSNPSAEQIVNSMSVGMAKAVYLELKKVFEA
jgi:hypothetical protein